MKFTPDDLKESPFGVLPTVVIVIFVAWVIATWKENKLKVTAVCFAVLVAFGALGYFIASIPEPKTICGFEYELPIKSLGLGKETFGNFFLGIGDFNERAVYYIYQQSGNGWILSRFYSDVWVLVEGEGSPRITSFACSKEGQGIINRTLEIHVPLGTIISGYKADVGELG